MTDITFLHIFLWPPKVFDTTQTLVAQCELWKPCCYRWFLPAQLWNKSCQVTVDLTGRDLIQTKNRAALGKHSITRGMTKLMEYDKRGAGLCWFIEQLFGLFKWLRFLLLRHQTPACIHSAQLTPTCVSVCLHVLYMWWCNNTHTHTQWQYKTNELVKRRKHWVRFMGNFFQTK